MLKIEKEKKVSDIFIFLNVIIIFLITKNININNTTSYNKNSLYSILMKSFDDIQEKFAHFFFFFLEKFCCSLLFFNSFDLKPKSLTFLYNG